MILVPSLADIEKNATSEAERRVARLLHGVEGDPDAVGFHSVRLRSHPYKQQAEADFVILWKNIVILIEVKGGGIRKHDGVWYSIDRRNDWHKLKTSPMEQAQSAMHALRSILNSEGVGWFASEAAVITPDIIAPSHDVGWLPTHWLAKDDMSIERMSHALDTIAGSAHAQPPNWKLARKGQVRERLFGEFARMPVIDAQRGAVIEEQNRATAGQARLLAVLARNSRIMTFGGAGTGKSLALVEAAKQEINQARSVLVTFHSPELLGYFAPHLGDRSIDLVPFGELGTSRLYDVVFVDEAQDLMTSDAMDLLDTVIAGGRSAGRWRMFLDMNNQAHVDGGFDEDVFEIVESDALKVDLDLNVRNTRAIVHMVQEYLGADVGDPGIVHGEKVQWHMPAAGSGVDAGEAVAAKLVAEGVRKEDIWIISASSVAATDVTTGGFVVKSPRFAKGLEAEHVIVCDLPQLFDEAAISALYVALTRARVSLHVVASKDDRGRLQQLLHQRRASQ